MKFKDSGWDYLKVVGGGIIFYVLGLYIIFKFIGQM